MKISMRSIFNFLGWGKEDKPVEAVAAKTKKQPVPGQEIGYRRIGKEYRDLEKARQTAAVVQQRALLKKAGRRKTTRSYG